jgi:Domain of unknown function (DUF3784)
MLLDLLPAMLLLLAGWLIKYKKVTWLISGYNTASRREKERYDVEKLCRHMGNFVFTLAGIFFVFAAARMLFSEYSESIMTIGIVVFVVVSLGGLVYLNTGNRLMKN